MNLPRYSQRARHTETLIAASLAAVDPAAAVRSNLRRDGDRLLVGQKEFAPDQGRVFLVGAGKAVQAMGAAAAGILGDLLAGGVLIGKRGDGPPTQAATGQKEGPAADLPAPLRLRLAGHPLPDQAGVAATAELLALLDQTRPSDLVLCLISGGASALLTQPRLPLDQWQRLVDALLASGCTINELNAVRKRMDRVKGGGLAQLAAPAACASLILSDVVGNPLDIIGSGPTVANPDDPALAGRILERYDLAGKLPPDDWQAIAGQLAILVGEDRPAPDAYNVIIGDVRRAAEAALAAAGQLGFEARLLTAHLEGEAREVGRIAAALAKDAAPNNCLVLGGETTVTLRGDGFGGRNLEVALAAALAIDGWPDRAVVTFATDGDDGPTDAAGALVTGQTVAQARQLGLDPRHHLDNNDSYPFLQATNSLIITGPTGTNVNDLLFILNYGQ